MTKYKYLKSQQQMRDELYTLWNNYEVYVFLQGYDWVKNREHEICHILTTDEREVFIETNRCDWILSEYRLLE
jgi:hypothetical protein